MAEKGGDSENETHRETERVGSSKKTGELSQGDAIKVSRELVNAGRRLHAMYMYVHVHVL